MHNIINIIRMIKWMFQKPKKYLVLKAHFFGAGCMRDINITFNEKTNLKSNDQKVSLIKTQ